ncbi:Stp1/IreP family PP2C-type Ser/Thr phosphatase [Halalkalibacterium ligniniphilum]|uniref:Stp1/IreP family PP2C-type Ser/Thr phosphatase n=1 Tax=Halalkalibacterium ligniniphilum TaxID=1134413 RepID=UPI000347FDD8|nr:Stp1/IreP family PP2C-type Ser/Thr phosphatase [Halalkalibacterium ligniniphilum]
MDFAFLTDVGRLRPHNEDNGGIVVNRSGVMAVVADGMGGHQAGDVASKMAYDLLEEAWQKEPQFESTQQVEQWLTENIARINISLYDRAKMDPNCQGMGTTLVVAVFIDEMLSIAHIGDSRAYLLNQFGFTQKTNDHSLVNELVRTGQITDEEAENHPRKNVLLRALGTEREVKMDVQSLNWEQGDILLLCSDGLSNKVDHDDILSILKQTNTVTSKVEQLIELANIRGGEDNITVALIENTGVSDER